MQVTEMKVGDLFPRPRLRLQADGVGLNLSDALSIIARVKLPGSSSSVEREVIVSDQDVTSNHGIITIVLLSGDTDYKGIIKFDVEVEWVTGVQTWPSKGYFKIWVLEDADSDQGGGVPSASQNDSLTFGRIYDVSITDPEDGQFISYDEELNRWVNKANNLSDLTDAAAARTALGLGTAATANTGTGAANVILGNDSRLTDTRTPSAHAASHASAGSDALTLAQSQVTDLTSDLSAKAPKTAIWLPGTSGNYVSTPDAAGFAVTDVDARLFMSMDDWTPAGNKNPVGQWNGTGNQRGWQIDIDTSGRFSIIWSTDGTYNPGVTYLAQQVSTANTFTNGVGMGLRCVFDVDNGAGGRAFSVYYRSDDDIESATGWTQLGSTNTTAGTTTIHNSTATLDIGACNNGGLVQGSIHRALLLDGIDGTIVASPDFTAPMGPRQRDAQGNIWTINGSAYAWEYV